MNYHRVIPLVLAAAVLLAGFAGCSREPGPEVWVIGLDGADWDQLEPMMARGELPHLAGLRDGGAWGILRSDMPMISPLLWTSIATGKAPDVHGVTWFMTDAADGSKMPISSYERKVRTFWSIASEADLTCGIVGWWATWPADPVNGWLVSDYVAWHSFGVTGRSSVDQGKTWPPDLMDLVNEVMPSPMDIPDSELMRMVHLPATALMPDPGADPYADPPAHLRQAMATSLGYTDLVLRKLGSERPRL
ncbi:MAG: alkaline phosphatase family protein, partial [Acidobacteriota bacterium]